MPACCVPSTILGVAALAQNMTRALSLRNLFTNEDTNRPPRRRQIHAVLELNWVELEVSIRRPRGLASRQLERSLELREVQTGDEIESWELSVYGWYLKP